ncbi:MAG: ribonuclease P protein component 4 [Promethearchaeota archaeon]
MNNDHIKSEEKKNVQKKKTVAYHNRQRRSKQKGRRYNIQKTLASERIEYLMEKAIKIYSSNSELANSYADLAKKYSMAVKVPIPSKYKKLICHKCKKLMIPGISSRTRIQSRKKRESRYIITCLHCNHQIHIYFKQKHNKNKEENLNLKEKQQ